MTNKETMLNGILKAGIIAAGTGIGMLVSKCFSVKEESEGEPDEPEVIDAEFVEIETKETEEV